MAPKRTNKRLNIPGNRTPATYDLKNQEHFNQFKRAGFIPPEYESYAQLQDAFLELVYQGASDKDAAEALGVDYRNVIGKGYLAAELSSKGIPRGISARVLREDIKPDEKAYLINRFGEDWFKAYERYRKLEWGDTKVLKKDKEIVERFSGRPVEEFTSAKQEADVLRDRLIAAFGKGGRGGQVHRGHGVSAMEGASVGKTNLVGEWGPLNAGHGSDPRYDYNVMRNLNMSATDLQNYYDDLLEQEGLTINPRRYAGNYLAADEALRELKQGTSIGNPQVTIPVEPTSVDPRSIEWRDRRLFEIEQQLAAEYERSGMAPNEAALKARQRVEEAALNQSTLFNVTQSRGGPTVTVQQAMPKPRQIGTVVGEQQFDPFGRPKLDRSGEPKFETRKIYEPPRRVILSRLDKGTPAASKPQTPIPKQVRTQADIDRIFGSVGGPETIKVSGNYIPKPPIITTPTAKDRALAAERANAGKFKEMARGSGPNLGMLLIPDPRSALKAVRENLRGAMAGVAVSALNPEVAQAVEQNNLGAAGNILARDVALGTLSEMGIKAALPLAGKYAPALAKIGGVAGTAGTGAALFSQGQSGSLTDVLTRKAAQNPISFMPAVQANPETDIGARASRAITNEVKYLSKQAKPLMKAIDNELRWLGKAGQRAFNNIFGKREI